MKNKRFQRCLATVLVLVLVCSCVPLAALAAPAEDRVYGPEGELEVTKISSPLAGEGDSDGINGDRLNSYAWAMTERDGAIYIGTNRAFISQQAYTVITKQEARLGAMAGGMNADELYGIFNLATYGEFPDYREVTDADAVPQIIKVDPETGDTVTLDMPQEFTEICDKLEGAAFRSVVNVDGILYFGSYATNYVFILRVDQNDQVSVAYKAGSKSTGEAIQYNSLRANACYDGVLYFGGTNSDLDVWEADPERDRYVPLFIGALEDDYDPATGEGKGVTFENRIADYRDFREYADPADPSCGNEFYDLVEYQGEFYVIVSDTVGFGVYMGHPARDGETANPYGWNWTLIVNGQEEDSPAHGYIAATPYLYQGKLYIGTFSNVSAIAQTGLQVAMWALSALNGTAVMTLKQALTPLYNLMNTTPSVFSLEDNRLVSVESASELLEGKCNVYLWRFLEYDGYLYMTTYDPSDMERYVLDIDVAKLIETYLGMTIQDLLRELGSGTNAVQANARNAALTAEEQAAVAQVQASTNSLSDLLRGNLTLDDIKALLEAVNNLIEAIKSLPSWLVNEELLATLEQLQSLLNAMQNLLNAIDDESMAMWQEMQAQLEANTYGFDMLRTADGETWEYVSDDGFGDMYNWGGRTLVAHDGSLYVGTANPFYGAQLWKVTDTSYTEAPWENPFVDIHESDWYYDDVRYMYENGLMVGTSATTFSPYDAMTRGMLSAVLYRLEGSPSAEGLTNPYTDVSETRYYRDAIAWATANGILYGVGNNKFEPDRDVTREEMVAILYRYAGWKGCDTSARADLAGFADASQVSAYAVDALSWAVAEEVLYGYTDGHTYYLLPGDSSTRAQVAAVFTRYCTKVAG